MPHPKITPFLTYDQNAEEAVTFYLSVFPDAVVHHTVRCTEAGPYPAGTVLTIEFELAGQRFVALNGGPHFKFSDGVSFFVACEDQEEIDRYWALLTDGGKGGRCGWLVDKFGLSWQIVPRRLMELMSSSDAQASARVMAAMLQMKKIEVDVLERAAAA